MVDAKNERRGAVGKRLYCPRYRIHATTWLEGEHEPGVGRGLTISRRICPEVDYVGICKYRYH